MIDQDRLARVNAMPLRAMKHASFEDGACLMEAVAWVAGEPWSDKPRCACPVIGDFLRHFNDGLPALKEFILPGGGEAAARCHIARTVVRRAERRTVELARLEDIRPQPVHYLNRLSDLLFVLARVLARASGHGEVLWAHERRK